MALSVEEIEYMVRSFGVEYQRFDRGMGSIFVIPLFGIKVVFEVALPNSEEKGWRMIYLVRDNELHIKQEELIWELVQAGYLHYMRSNFPTTFKRLLSMHNWDMRLIKKRLDTYKDLPKYNYLRTITEEANGLPSSAILSVEPGFFDFLVTLEDSLCLLQL